MTRRRYSIGLLFIALLLGGTPVWAQQQTEESDTTTEEQTQSEQQETQAQEQEEQQTSGDEAQAAPRQGDDDTFRPSEEISEDVPVSFPVDI